VAHIPSRPQMKTRAEVEDFLRTMQGYYQKALVELPPAIATGLYHQIEALEWVLNQDIIPLDEFLLTAIGDLVPLKEEVRTPDHMPE
jgi:hypothetical protein